MKTDKEKIRVQLSKEDVKWFSKHFDVKTKNDFCLVMEKLVKETFPDSKNIRIFYSDK
jgi:hypothetical protein